MWNQSAEANASEEEILNGVLDMEDQYTCSVKSPQPSATLQVGDGTMFTPLQSPGVDSATTVLTSGQQLQLATANVPFITAPTAVPAFHSADPELLKEVGELQDASSLNAMLTGGHVVLVKYPNGQITAVNIPANPIVQVKDPQPSHTFSASQQQPSAANTGNWQADMEGSQSQGQEEAPMLAEQAVSPGQIPLFVEQFDEGKLPGVNLRTDQEQTKLRWHLAWVTPSCQALSLNWLKCCFHPCVLQTWMMICELLQPGDIFHDEGADGSSEARVTTRTSLFVNQCVVVSSLTL